MLFLFALSCLAAATVGSVFVYQRGVAGRLPANARQALPPAVERPSKKPERPAPSAEASLETLDLGDVVQDGDEDFIVSGVVRYREERESWTLSLLDSGSARRWLEVRKKGGLVQASFLEVVTDAPTFGQLGGGLTYRGKPFSLAARGDARTSVTGETDNRAAGILKYTRYAGPGGETLLIEEEGGVKRALFGSAVPPSSLSILGGELVRERDAAG